MPRKRKRVNLTRLRKSVTVTNRIYGLLVQAHDALRDRVFELESRTHNLEMIAGLKWSHVKGSYE